MREATTVLFRPVGPSELELIRSSGWRRWPPRLREQPIFYPVTNEQYAFEIASRWNVAESGAGYVTMFRVRSNFIERYDVHCVGAAHHTEWWIPAADLEQLNENIVGTIEVVWSSDGGSNLAPSDRLVDTLPGGGPLRVRFEGPSNGWLGVTLTGADREWQNVVSYVPNDFLRELVTALLSCIEDHAGTFVAQAHTEPEVYLFRFQRSADVDLTIFEKRLDEPVFAFAGPVQDVVIPFWRALRRLETSFAEDQWRQPFPEREMAALTRLTDDVKTSAR